MRILWISPNGGNYKLNSVKGSGGWIGSLEYELTRRSDIELGIAFFHNTDNEVVKSNHITYFPVCIGTNRSKILKLFKAYISKENVELNKKIERLVQVVYSFAPDIIHIWGIENDYAEIIPYLYDKYKIVVHIQGLTSSIIYTYLPPFVSLMSINKVNSIKNLITRETQGKYFSKFIYRSKRELKYAPLVKYWIGRTDWDKKASEMLSPSSRYFHCDELLRDDFRNYQWKYHYDGKIVHIHSSIGPKWYKGIDVILKTAYILKQKEINISWKIYGIQKDSPYVRFFMKLYKLSAVDLGILFCGYADAETIRNSLLHCDMYVHPSYIENSSNAIAEAMMLGVPTIAQYVGGNPSMLKNNSGVLVAPNEPYMMAFEIMKMRDKDWAEGYSARALEVSKSRQSGVDVVNSLLEIYTEIINNPQ